MTETHRNQQEKKNAISHRCGLRALPFGATNYNSPLRNKFVVVRLLNRFLRGKQIRSVHKRAKKLEQIAVPGGVGPLRSATCSR